MGQGQGSVINNQKKAATGTPGPPFAPGSADNGLSVDPVTGEIVLGNDAGGGIAQFLSNREIPFNGFNLRFQSNSPNTFISVDPLVGILLQSFPFIGPLRIADLQPGLLDLFDNGAPSTISLRDSTGQINIARELLGNNVLNIEDGLGTVFGYFDWTNDIIQIGDRNAVTTGAGLNVNVFGRQLEFADNTGEYLNIDIGGALYEMGDISSAGNGMRLIINDATRNARIGGDTTGANNGIEIVIDDLNEIISLGDVFLQSVFNIDVSTTPGSLEFRDPSGDQYFIVDPGSAQIYAIGDIAANFNGSNFLILDVLQQFQFVSNTTLDHFLFFDIPNAIYQIGDIDGTVAPTYIEILPNTEIINLFSQQVNCGGGLFTNDPASLINATTALTNAAGASLGTLTNAPSAGNPAKWIQINDGGTIRKIPTWT